MKLKNKLLIAAVVIAILVGVIIYVYATQQNAVIFQFKIGKEETKLEPSTLELNLGTLAPGSSGTGFVDASMMPKLYCGGSVNLTLMGNLECFIKFTVTIHFFDWATGNSRGAATVSLSNPSVIYNVGAKECRMSMDYEFTVSSDVAEGITGAVWVQFS